LGDVDRTPPPSEEGALRGESAEVHTLRSAPDFTEQVHSSRRETERLGLEVRARESSDNLVVPKEKQIPGCNDEDCGSAAQDDKSLNRIVDNPDAKGPIPNEDGSKQRAKSSARSNVKESAGSELYAALAERKHQKEQHPKAR